MKRYTLDLTEELHKKLKVHCAIEGLEMSEVIRKLIADYLEKAERKQSKK
jgi:metal-responsive CopG/Arc/MetJ family transcriptional regulator